MKLLFKSIALAAAIALGSASTAQAQINPPIVNVDVCPLLDGIQLNILDCPPAEGGGGGIDVGVDVCLDVPGIQLDVGDCPPGGGSGVGVGVDVCLDVPGIQLDVGDCAPGGVGGGVGVDVCLDMPGIQLDVGLCQPAGGGTDVCPAIPGIQTTPAACPPVGPGGPAGPGGPLGPIGGANVDTTPLGAIGVPAGGQVCFFSAINYGESSFCLTRGVAVPVLGSWDNVIRSISVPAGLSVEVCVDEGFAGQCTTMATSLPQLHGGWDRQISSVRVL